MTLPKERASTPAPAPTVAEEDHYVPLTPAVPPVVPLPAAVRKFEIAYEELKPGQKLGNGV
jgi:hypothetical protein